MLFTISAALALLNYVVAQDSSNGTASTADISNLQANFNQAHLVPDLLTKFNPEGTLDVSFSGSAITVGQKLEQTAVASSPSLSVVGGANASDINGSNKYTVIMIDADIVGTNGASTPLTRHWLVNGAGLNTASSPYAVTYDSATTITDYAGPGPAEGSGPHRYTVLVYLQPDSFQAPANLSTAGTPLGTMLLTNYVTESGLGNIVAANYFQVENGQATVSLQSTTSVDTATVGSGVTTSAATGSTTSAHASGSAASGASASGSKTSSPAAASSTGAASSQRELGWGVVMGAAGVAGAVFGAGMGI